MGANFHWLFESLKNPRDHFRIIYKNPLLLPSGKLPQMEKKNIHTYVHTYIHTNTPKDSQYVATELLTKSTIF